MTAKADSAPNRRSFLKILGAAPAVAGVLVACSDSNATSSGGTDADAAASSDVGGDLGAGGDSGGGDSGLADLADGGDTSASCELTGSDIEGPFYVAGAPERAMLAAVGEEGDRLVISGTVYQADGCTPLAGALLDVWQADAEGNYHTSTDEYRLRGQMMTDDEGSYSFETIMPGRYLNAGSFRPAHIHFTVTRPGLQPLTTQMYFAGDPYLQPNDSCGICASDDPTLIIELADDGEIQRGTFDIVLAAG